MILVHVLLGCPGPAPADTAQAEAPCDDASGNICTWAGTGDAGFYGEGEDRLQNWFYFPLDVEMAAGKPPIISDWNNHRLRMVQADDTIVTIMGTLFVGDGPPDASDKVAPGAPGGTVNLNHPTDAVWLPDGKLLSASWHTHKLRTWDPATGLVMVHCGNTPGFVGDNDEDASTALMNQPKAVEIDPETGTIYVADMRNQRVRVLTPEYTIHTLAGNGTKAFLGDDGLAADAQFAFPSGTNPRPGGSLALHEGGLYVADTENHRIRRIDLTAGTITTVAGNPTQNEDGTWAGGFSGDGGAATSAQLNYPTDIEIAGGVMYIADTDNSRVRVVDLATGVIDTFAGNGEDALAGDGGPAVEASLHHPYGVAVDEHGVVYITDTYNHVIRAVYP